MSEYDLEIYQGEPTAHEVDPWFHTGRELAYAELIANQGPITGLVDIVGLSINFDVATRPVTIVAYLPLITRDAQAGGTLVAIADQAGVEKARVVPTNPAAATTLPPLLVYDRITIPGNYTRKVRVSNNAVGTGQVTVWGGATYRNFIKAIEH